MEKKEQKPVAVVSGGLGMIGLAVTREFLARGFSVAPLYHKTIEATVKEKLDSLSSSHVFGYQLDLTDHSEVVRTLGEIEREIGPIAVGVHAANGPILRKKVSEISLNTFREQFLVGLFGGFNFFSALAQFMKQRKKGTLIGITTTAVEGDEPVQGSFGGYISAKFALKGLLSELREELKPFNIHVYAVAPGFIDGGLNADLPARLVEFMKEKSPSGKLTEPSDVAATITRLLLFPDQFSDALTVVSDMSRKKNV
ncbi:MAG: SDR family oxidoreductase [bacterium]|nr:SDR family oxidoreductase [bacterium]